MTYPAYDVDTTCRACGHVGANTEYRATGRCVHLIDAVINMGEEINERLHRTCRRCGYQWDESLIGMKESATLHGKVQGPTIADLERDPDQDSHRQI